MALRSLQGQYFWLNINNFLTKILKVVVNFSTQEVSKQKLLNAGREISKLETVVVRVGGERVVDSRATNLGVKTL